VQLANCLGQIMNGVRHGHQTRFNVLGRRDHQSFIPNRKRQFQLIEHQPQQAPQGNIIAPNRHGPLGAYSRFIQIPACQDDRDAALIRQLGQPLVQREIECVDRDGFIQAGQNRLLRLGAASGRE
jgi:hypothetical protein